MTREDIKTINNIVHKTIYGFFDICGDNEEVPITDKDKLLLEVNKAICNNIKALEQEPKIGHWIDGDKTRWKCSNCGYGVLDWNNTPYCPNCGAKVESENKG